MLTANLNPGDKVCDTYFHQERGVVISHPADNEKIVVVFSSQAYVFANHCEISAYYCDWTLVDEAREIWDNLNSELRSHIKTVCDDWGKKIAAIKLLRAMTGMGLVDARRAVETFPA